MKKAIYYLIVYSALQLAAFIFPGAVIIGGIMVATGCGFRPAVEQSLVWILLVEYLFVSWLFLKKKWAYLNWGSVLRRDRLSVVLLSVILTIAWWFLYGSVLDLFLQEDANINTLANESISAYVIVAECVLTLIIPLAEELLFRGAMLRAIYIRHHNIVLAIIVSAALFGVTHWDFYQGIGAFITGIILGWMYYQTGSLIPGIIIHTANNILSKTWFIYIYGFNTSVADLFPNSSFYVLFIIVMALVFFLCCFFFHNKYKHPVDTWPSWYKQFF